MHGAEFPVDYVQDHKPDGQRKKSLWGQPL